MEEAVIAGPAFLSYKQTMSFLGLSSTLLWRLTHHKDPDKRIPSYKMGRLRKYKKEELIWWAEKNKT